MWQEADEEVNQLFNLMTQVREKMDRKCPSSRQNRTSLNLRQFTWEQVIGEVQSLAARWSSSPTRSSKMMRCLEKLGKNSDAFNSWLELLPAGDYGSRYSNINRLFLVLIHAKFTASICGVFTIAVGVRYDLIRLFYHEFVSPAEVTKMEK